MPRRPRPHGEGLIYHTLNRGNNRRAVFEEEEDFAVYLHALGQTKSRYPFRLYGYVLMTNHVHLLLAPMAGTSLSRIMQSLTVAHTWWYHRRRRTSGHVWQGRKENGDKYNYLSRQCSTPAFGCEVQILDLTAAVRGGPMWPSREEDTMTSKEPTVVEIDGFRGRLISADHADYDIARAVWNGAIEGAKAAA